MQRALVLLAFLSAAHSAFAQSFDCARAQTRIEKLVCADRGVADLDEYLGRYSWQTVLRAEPLHLPASHAGGPDDAR